MQSVYLIPVIQQAYSDQHEKLMERLMLLCASGKKVELCGDAKSDSPGKHLAWTVNPNYRSYNKTDCDYSDYTVWHGNPTK